MAEGGNVPKLGGYDYEFTSKVPEYWECLVCHLTLKDPVQIEKCGHRLCNICMESLLRRPSPTCPADRQLLSGEKIFSDTACHRQILGLTVKCSHCGCSWTGELRDVEKHRSQCLFKVVKCPNSGCTKMFSKRDMTTHETLECSWREIHLDICQKFPVPCTNKCGLRDIPREKLEIHARDECPATEVQCEYKNLGCEAVFPRTNANIHSETEVKSHLNLALRCLENTQHHVHELVTVINDQSQQIDRQSQQIERLISKNKEQSQEIERLISNQSHQIERCGLTNQFSSTPFEWEIPNIHDVCQRAVIQKYIIRSKPFNLSGYNYLLKIEFVFDLLLSFTLNARHACLYIKVVPGKYDQSISWPCKEKVRVTVIDQEPCQDNRENVSHVIDFGENPSSRPLFDDDLGYTYILNLRDFIYSRSFIKDDTIVINVLRE